MSDAPLRLSPVELPGVGALRDLLAWKAIGLGDKAFGLADRAVTLSEDVWRSHKAGTLRPVLVDLRAAKPDPTPGEPHA